MQVKKDAKTKIVSGRITEKTEKQFVKLQVELDRTESYLVNKAVMELVERSNGKRHG